MTNAYFPLYSSSIKQVPQRLNIALTLTIGKINRFFQRLPKVETLLLRIYPQVIDSKKILPGKKALPKRT